MRGLTVLCGLLAALILSVAPAYAGGDENVRTYGHPACKFIQIPRTLEQRQASRDPISILCHGLVNSEPKWHRFAAKAADLPEGLEGFEGLWGGHQVYTSSSGHSGRIPVGFVLTTECAPGDNFPTTKEWPLCGLFTRLTGIEGESAGYARWVFHARLVKAEDLRGDGLIQEQFLRQDIVPKLMAEGPTLYLQMKTRDAAQDGMPFHVFLTVSGNRIHLMRWSRNLKNGEGKFEAMLERHVSPLSTNE